MRPIVFFGIHNVNKKKVLLSLSGEEIAAMHGNTAHYVENLKRYLSELKPLP